jgi:hypothetical protein
MITFADYKHLRGPSERVLMFNGRMRKSSEGQQRNRLIQRVCRSKKRWANHSDEDRSKSEIVFAEMLCMAYVDELDDHRNVSLGALVVYVTTAE